MNQKRSSRHHDSPTLSDVAAHAEVSPMTVSRVINGAESVSQKTRQRVLESIKEIGYAPNEAARSLAGAPQIRIGLLYSNPSAAYLSDFLIGCLEEAATRNLLLLVEKCSEAEEAVDAVMRLVNGGVDGILLPPPLSDSETVLEALDESDVPAVVVAAGNRRANISAVSIDDYHASRAMTEHIVARGHQRIGFITGDRNQQASQLRLAGYKDALHAAGISVDDNLIVDGDFSYRSGLAAAERLLNFDLPPSAIFASNDDMAAATVAIAHRRGIEVPGDLSVCGFDDSSLATTIWPELTTIHQPIVDMSSAAVDLLASKIAARRKGSREDSRHLILDYTLIQRQSDASLIS